MFVCALCNPYKMFAYNNVLHTVLCVCIYIIISAVLV